MEQKSAFEQLNAKLITGPVVACPDFTKTFVLQTDVSECGFGVVLMQDMENEERMKAYASRHLNAAEKKYSATEKEHLAII